MKHAIYFFFLLLCCQSAFGLAVDRAGHSSRQASVANGFELRAGHDIVLQADTAGRPVLATAFSMLERDCQAVLGSRLRIGKKRGDIVLGFAEGPKEGFAMHVSGGRLCITASDAHGAAYALLEVSRMMGVSPWEWWADAVPQRRDRFCLPEGYADSQHPHVEYRGIFINDEDWGLMPWSSQTYEPTETKGEIGPKTTARIFELMLRLRANYYWPPMHECTQPFFLTPGNREVARQYGIYIGGSHCEPMASSTAVEWKRRGVGDYDYVHNKENVLRFWQERVQEVADQPIVYTIGMRGVHDGAMQGAKTVEEQKKVLEQVFRDQRNMLASPLCPQVFIPYKEVLDVYAAGLEVPDDVCLMWTDDNYGYIRHFPTETERSRSGGNGIYYHVSYWGRPHDYLWLGTFSPWLLVQQMTEAYNRGIQRMWILNVGDIKPAEYQTELFMDMAWNGAPSLPDFTSQHLNAFLSREFGAEAAAQLLPVMTEHYRLAYIRKPEFMGGTRTEERDPMWKQVRPLEWPEEYKTKRLDDYMQLSDRVEAIEKLVPADRRDTYFQLVKYPVQAAAQMNRKFLAFDNAAYDSIQRLTHTYNKVMSAGKWDRMMDCRPRRLPVFERVASAPPNPPKGGKSKSDGFAGWQAARLHRLLPPSGGQRGAIVIPGLGYDGQCIGIPRGASIAYGFEYQADSVDVVLHLLPAHPVSDSLRIAVSIDNGSPVVVDYHTEGRSEEWKQNVLRNQAIRRIRLPLEGSSTHTLQLQAIDNGVVLDQIEMYQASFLPASRECLVVDTIVKDGKPRVMAKKTVWDIVDGKKVVSDSMFVDGRFVGMTRTNWNVYEGMPMPRFTVKTEDGSTIDSGTLVGKTVVISFWIPTCAPCLKELRRVGPEIIDKLPADKFVFLAIGASATAEEAVAFRQKAGATFPLCHDESGTVMPMFADQGCPKIFVVGPDGIVRHAEGGYNDDKFELLKRKISEAME